MNRSLCFALTLSLAVLCMAVSARADDVTEASALFDSGNQHFQAGMRARGGRRGRELEAALDDYFASLRLVRSRNVLYNCALVLEQLERWDDAFNYWTEYLGVVGLSESERADGTTRRDALRERVAVARIESTAERAEVWIDRRDLAARGRTPLEIALPEGEHTLWLVLSGWEDAEAQVTVRLGATETLRVALVAEPVMVQVLAPEARLLLDGVEIRAGASLPVPPGEHLLTLELDGRPAIERRFEVVPGAPMVIDLTTAVAALGEPERAGPTLHVTSNAPARILVDGLFVASGAHLDVPMSAGDHEITAEPTVGPSWRAMHTFGDADLSLELDAHGTSGGLLAARGIFGTLAVLGLLSAGGLSIGAGLANDAYRQAPSQAGFDSVNRLNLAADLGWGISAAMGIAAIVFLLAEDAGTEGHFEASLDGPVDGPVDGPLDGEVE